MMPSDRMMNYCCEGVINLLCSTYYFLLYTCMHMKQEQIQMLLIKAIPKHRLVT